jgi:hypothetical protein
MTWEPTAYPAEFYSPRRAGQGHPDPGLGVMFGPTLLSKVLGLNETQESSLGLVFHYADTKGLWLDTIEDLRAVIQFLTSDEGKADLKDLGGLSSATAGVILRELITFSAQGADVFFGLPEFDTSDLLRVAPDGRGIVSMLELPAVQDRPQLFSTFLMWLLADLFHDLPEVGRPRQAEAGLLLRRGAPALQRREQGLPRRHPADRSAHPLQGRRRLLRHPVAQGRAHRCPRPARQPGAARPAGVHPGRQKALRAAVSTYPHTAYDLEELLTSLGTGEAVITVLSERGAPTPVAWTRMRAPQSLMAPRPTRCIDGVVAASPLAAKYVTAIERDSASEMLGKKVAEMDAAATAAAQEAENAKVREAAAAQAERDRLAAEKQAAKDAAAAEKAAAAAAKREAEEPGVVEQVVKSSVFKSMLRSAGTVIGREITRSIFGTSRR